MFRHPSTLPWVLLSLFGLGALGFSLVDGRAASDSSVAASPQLMNAAESQPRDRHFVTPAQLADANARPHEGLGTLTAIDSSGETVAWTTLSRGRPVVLAFLREGCPCNGDFDPLFRRVRERYEDAATFAGVIDADLDGARRFVESQHVPYQMLIDPNRELIRRLSVRNGCYLTLMTADGAVDRFWPGISADVLRDLGARIAALAGIDERPLLLSDVPAGLTTGCPFDDGADTAKARRNAAGDAPVGTEP